MTLSHCIHTIVINRNSVRKNTKIDFLLAYLMRAKLDRQK